MPVFQKSKLFVSLASLPVSCLLAGSVIAQVDTVSEVSPVFESLPIIEPSTLPIPPRQLPALRISERSPSAVDNPFVDQFRQAREDQANPTLSQPESGLPPQPNFTSNLKNWRQAFDGLRLNLEQTESQLPSSSPDASPGVPASAAETIRIAKVQELESTNSFSIPGLRADKSMQIAQDTIGELDPSRLDFTDSTEEAELVVPPLPNGWGEAPTQVYQPRANEFDASGFAAAPLAPKAVDASSDESLVWWKQEIQAATIPGGTLQSVETNSLVFFMLKRSPRLRAVSQNPLIREQRISEAEAEFDPVSFLRSQFQDRVDPVGDTLTVTNDGTNFLDDHIWTADLGLRRKTTSGATVELNQRLGFRNSNSAIFLPQDQGTAALSLNVSQPLMRGRGKYFNQSQILIAQAATNASWDTLAIELQNEIQTVVESYWRLYFDRCVFLQKQMNVKRAQKVLEKLEGRSELDALPNQIARARSAVLSRKTELANARRDIRNSETDIRRLTADKDWAASQMIELLPVELPDLTIPITDLEQVILTAINNRPEVAETLKRSKIAAIQRDISVNELMPELSLLFGTYVSSLQGDSQLGDAFIDQFGRVKPGYSVGVEFEMPIRNRAARSRLTQRKLQINLIKAEIEETLQNVIAESQIARRRVASAKETLIAATEAIHAARLDLEQNEGRWESFALIEGDIAEGQSPTIVLDQLLDSQTRLVEAEFVYSQAEMELKISEIALQRTMGTLLTHESVDYRRGCKDNTPAVEFDVAR